MSSAACMPLASCHGVGTAHLGIQRDTVLDERFGDVIGRRAGGVSLRLARGAVRRHGDDCFGKVASIVV